jgi:predicted small lipoprotein YifL
VKKTALVSLLLVGLVGAVACGTVGPPIPPEEVGLAAKIIEQKEKERQAKQKDVKPAEEEKEDEVALPPVRPIGTPPGLN